MYTKYSMDDLNKLKYLLNKKKSLAEIHSAMGREIYEIYEMTLYLKHLGQGYDIIDNVPQKVGPEQEIVVPYRVEVIQKQSICLVSDTHYGSLYDRPDIMDFIYKECEERGIRSIFCAGDFTDGYYPSRDIMSKEQKIHGASEMIDYVAHTHPYSKNITFYTIGGNHDQSFRRSDGIDICAAIANIRSDIIYLNSDSANLFLGPLTMVISHGYGGKMPNTRVKNWYNPIPEDEKPSILQLGHIHKAFFLKVDDTYIFQTGCLMNFKNDDNTSHKESDRSCWFADITYDENGNILQMDPELMTFGTARMRRR